MKKTPESGRTRWHRLLGRLFEELLTPTGVSVFTEFPVMSESPEADILLLRKNRKEWTDEQLQRLPDSIRDSGAEHILIEFKYTESVTEKTFRQVIGYDIFYMRTRKLTENEVQSFIISAKTPQEAILRKFTYSPAEKAGVYRSGNPLLETFPLLSLNELSDEPHNAFVKCFASRKKQKLAAFSTLKQQSLKTFNRHFHWFIEGLLYYWFAEKGKLMKTPELTPEKVTEMGKMWADLILSGLSPEEVLARYKPEEVLARYKPEERLKGLTQEEIEAYLRKIRKKDD